MPLLKHATCSECGKTAWHEFVARGAAGECCWVCRECGNQRSAPRVSLGPQYGKRQGKIQTSTASNEVNIVNLSVLGARLELVEEEVLQLKRGDRILFNAKLQPVGPLGEYRRATVRWTKGSEIGVAFTPPILASASDLTRIIKN